MKRSLLCFFAFSTILVACNNRNKSKTYETAALEKDDSTFLAFKDTAQRKIKTFIDSVDLHGKDYENYSFLVKSDFVEGDKHEHMWSRIYKRNNNLFIGTFIDSAYEVKNIKTGDSVSVYKDQIEDWSINNKRTGKTIGEFSIKYLKSKMH